jgi:hypothetical protein
MQQARKHCYIGLIAIAVSIILLVDIGQCLGTTKGGIDVHARNTSERKRSTFYDDAHDINNDTTNAFSFYTPVMVVALILVITALTFVSKRNENKH